MNLDFEPRYLIVSIHADDDTRGDMEILYPMHNSTSNYAWGHSMAACINGVSKNKFVITVFKNTSTTFNLKTKQIIAIE